MSTHAQRSSNALVFEATSFMVSTKTSKKEEAKTWSSDSDVDPSTMVAAVCCPCLVVFRNFKSAGFPDQGKRFGSCVGILYGVVWMSRFTMDCYFSRACTPQDVYAHDQGHAQRVLRNKYAIATEYLLIVSMICFVGSLVLQRLKLGKILGITYAESAKAFFFVCCMCFPCVLAHEELVVQEHVWVSEGETSKEDANGKPVKSIEKV